MSLLDKLKEQHNEINYQQIDVDGLGIVFFKPLTLGQARQIDEETGSYDRIARHFQVRAKDDGGRPLIKPGEFDEFKRYANAESVTDAVIQMQQLDSDETLEQAEKKS